MLDSVTTKALPEVQLACANSHGSGERRAVVTTHRSEVPAYLPRQGELPLVGYKAVLFGGQPDSAGLRVVTTSTLAPPVATLKQFVQRCVLCYDERTGDRNSSRDGSSAPGPAVQRQRLHFTSVTGPRTGRPADDTGDCAGCSRPRDDVWQTR